MTFKNIKAGDKVTFWNTGYGLDANRKQIRRKVTAKVNGMLLFDGHVVVNHTAFGKVVDEGNYISHK